MAHTVVSRTGPRDEAVDPRVRIMRKCARRGAGEGNGDRMSRWAAVSTKPKMRTKSTEQHYGSLQRSGIQRCHR